jgi:hypothetical protein
LNYGPQKPLFFAFGAAEKNEPIFGDAGHTRSPFPHPMEKSALGQGLETGKADFAISLSSRV